MVGDHQRQLDAALTARAARTRIHPEAKEVTTASGMPPRPAVRQCAEGGASTIAPFISSRLAAAVAGLNVAELARRTLS